MASYNGLGRSCSEITFWDSQPHVHGKSSVVKRKEDKVKDASWWRIWPWHLDWHSAAHAGHASRAASAGGATRGLQGERKGAGCGGRARDLFSASERHFPCRRLFPFCVASCLLCFRNKMKFKLGSLPCVLILQHLEKKYRSFIHAFIRYLLSNYHAQPGLTVKKGIDTCGSSEAFGFLKHW